MSAAPSDEMSWLPTDETPLVDAAVAYAAHGFRVLPVWWIRPDSDRCACSDPECRGVGSSAGKHPIEKAWQKKASSDVDVVRNSWGRRRNANIGLEMGGPDRLIAIDIDGEQGRRSWAELEAGVAPAPATLTSASGRPDGGEHRIFRVPPHLDMKRLANRSSVKKLTGLDIRVDRGQIVAAPSVHASGSRYRWTVRAPIADLPEWLFEALASPIELGRPLSPPAPAGRVVDFAKPYVRKVLENAAEAIASTKKGGRNSLLFAKASTVFEYYVGEGLDHLEAWRRLGEAGVASGLPTGEVESVLQKAWKRAQGQPRRVPPPSSPAAPLASSPADAPPASSGTSAGGDEWTRGLDRNVEGFIKKTLGNVITILALDPRWAGVVAYDAFAEAVVTTRPPPVRPQDAPIAPTAGDWTDEDDARTATWLGTEHNLDVAPSLVAQAIPVVAQRHVIHPVRDYLTALAWDGVPRLDGLFSTYFGAADNEYSRCISARWMISAVARVMRPGCQADCTVVLESRKHGTGKSTGLEILAGQKWFADTGLTVGDKDSYQCLRRKWVYELGELNGIKGRDLHRYKNFLSARVDNYRASFGRRNRDYPRQVVFAGTTNEGQYLEDRTGNRRFWPVRVAVTRAEVDRTALARDRDQLWAEARARFDRGDAWHADTPEFRALAENEQSERVQDDPWDVIVGEWLRDPWVPRHDPSDGRFKLERLDVKKEGVSTADVLIGALKKRAADISRHDETRAGETLRALGLEPARIYVEDGSKRKQRVRRYFEELPPIPSIVVDGNGYEDRTKVVLGLSRPVVPSETTDTVHDLSDGTTRTTSKQAAANRNEMGGGGGNPLRETGSEVGLVVPTSTASDTRPASDGDDAVGEFFTIDDL